jgi:23S rRNA (guanosine2251-2'-O)-methyltransferase
MKENDIIFGAHAIIEALKAGKEFNKILIDKTVKNAFTGEIRNLAKELNVIIQYVPTEKINSISRKNHQGFIAFISPVIYHKLADVVVNTYEQGKTPLILILDRITDVRNFGSIARSCECMGVNAIVVPTRGAALINADAIKTSSGALHTIPVCREENLKEALKFLADSGIQLVGCTEKTDQMIYDIDFAVPTVIVLGSEEDGISPEYLKLCNAKAKIPMVGDIESLNVAVSAGVILYEVRRQRKSE